MNSLIIPNWLTLKYHLQINFFSTSYNSKNNRLLKPINSSFLISYRRLLNFLVFLSVSQYSSHFAEDLPGFPWLWLHSIYPFVAGSIVTSMEAMWKWNLRHLLSFFLRISNAFLVEKVLCVLLFKIQSIMRNAMLIYYTK